MANMMQQHTYIFRTNYIHCTQPIYYNTPPSADIAEHKWVKSHFDISTYWNRNYKGLKKACMPSSKGTCESKQKHLTYPETTMWVQTVWHDAVSASSVRSIMAVSSNCRLILIPAQGSWIWYGTRGSDLFQFMYEFPHCIYYRERVL